MYVPDLVGSDPQVYRRVELEFRVWFRCRSVPSFGVITRKDGLNRRLGLRGLVTESDSNPGLDVGMGLRFSVCRHGKLIPYV